jgi:CRISPR-associated protein Csx10
MPVLKVVITARAPLVFSERRPGNQFRPSMRYIPGGVIRGALAQQFLDAGWEGDEDFGALFTSPGAPLFRNAYPALLSTTSSERTFASSRLLPTTAYSCKTEAGFARPVGDTGEVMGHGVFDGLVDRLCCELLGVRVPYRPRCNHPDHDGQGERVEAYAGLYAKTERGPRDVDVGLRLSTRVAVNRQRRVAEERMLYSPLVLDEVMTGDDGKVRAETTFHSGVVVGHATRALVERWLPRLTHVGSGVARGFGQVAVTVEGAGANDPTARVERFNKLLADRWEKWEPLRDAGALEPVCKPGSGTFFSVMLMSDAVLCEEGWSPTVRLEPDMLGAVGRNATLLRCYASAGYNGGWNTAWRLPKDTELVARMGGVYVYHTTDSVGDESWLEAIRALEENGVGERKREGFGQVCVCDEFHGSIQEVRQ